MSIRQKRTRELDDQDKSRRLVFCPSDRARFCVRNRAARGRPDRWKEKFRPDRGLGLLQPMCLPARRSPRTLSAEAGAEYFALCRSRTPQFGSKSVAGLFDLARPGIFGSTMAR